MSSVMDSQYSLSFLLINHGTAISDYSKLPNITGLISETGCRDVGIAVKS